MESPSDLCYIDVVNCINYRFIWTKRQAAMTLDRTDKEPTAREILECMREIMKPIPALTRRYSNQTILLALLTHAGAGLRELLASGQCTREDVERWCQELHILAFGKRRRLARVRRALQ
jgi:hypothetical protein